MTAKDKINVGKVRKEKVGLILIELNKNFTGITKIYSTVARSTNSNRLAAMSEKWDCDIFNVNIGVINSL